MKQVKQVEKDKVAHVNSNTIHTQTHLHNTLTQAVEKVEKDAIAHVKRVKEHSPATVECRLREKFCKFSSPVYLRYTITKCDFSEFSPAARARPSPQGTGVFWRRCGVLRTGLGFRV